MFLLVLIHIVCVVNRRCRRSCRLQPFKDEEPNVEVRKSGICEGWGLWTTTNFVEGEIICRFSGTCIDHLTAQHSQSKYILGPISSSYVLIRKKYVLKHW